MHFKLSHLFLKCSQLLNAFVKCVELPNAFLKCVEVPTVFLCMVRNLAKLKSTIHLLYGIVFYPTNRHCYMRA